VICFGAFFVALGDFSQRKSTFDFPYFFSIFLVFFFALLVFAAAAASCLCVEGSVFVSLLVCSESFLAR